MRDELRRVALFGSGVAELTRHRAEQIARELVKAGELRGKEASSFVRDLRARSKENRKEVMRLVRSEIQNQIASLGVATKRDVERLERRVARLEGKGKKPTAKKKSPSAPKTTAARSAGS
ncbi:MAG: phasin family protein [Actinomycetota bacterium]